MIASDVVDAYRPLSASRKPASLTLELGLLMTKLPMPEFVTNFSSFPLGDLLEAFGLLTKRRALWLQARSIMPVHQKSPTAHVWTQEDHDLFSEIMNEAGPSSSAAPEEAVDVSFAAPQRFSHGSQIAPDSMVDRLFHRGLLPDSDQPTMTYEIQGHRYTAGLDECNRVLLVHNPAEDQVLGVGRAGVPDFGAFFAENRRYGRPLPQQWATPALIDKLREEGFMPTANSPTTIHLNGRAYKAELAEGGFVKLTRV
ncbi:hypothetical protein ACVIQT_002812 [Bradyrhizobium diazoefficiens]